MRAAKINAEKSHKRKIITVAYHYRRKEKNKRNKMKFCGLLIASFSLSLLLIESSTGSLMCYSNSDFTENTEWNIQICNKTTNETSCLAQYRYHNDKLLPSYFGCHTTDTPCDPDCTFVQGQGNDWSCCCSSDLCNEFLGDLGINTMANCNFCETANCSQNCMESNDVAQCYCDYGYTLDVDEKTCIDVNECLHNNGGCQGTCHNEEGTGYHCSCPSHQQLKDGFLCEDYAGPVCYYQGCTETACTSEEPVASQCDASNPNAHCQATYSYDETNGFSVRLLSCFNVNAPCEQENRDTYVHTTPVNGDLNDNNINGYKYTNSNTGGCTLSVSAYDSSIYYCCCDGPFCNGNLTFPAIS